MTLQRIATADLTLSVEVGEPATGAGEVGDAETVLLLHGFPDSHKLWRYQVPVLREAGYRTVAPDLRGFGDSDRPADVDGYRLPHSVADAVAVLDALGVERAHVVCHDFGAVVGWLLAALQPERVDRLAVLSVGHPMTSRRPTIEQREKQWYTLLFQFEDVAEQLLTRDDWALLREWTAGTGDVENWLADLSRPGALTAGLNWYRANMHPARQLRDGPQVPSVAAPTLGLWSDGDRYLTEDGMQRSAEFVQGSWRYERVEHASHWMQLDQPEMLNRLLLQHLRG
ncbi:MAG TPA: alpha/beta hydrolase [Frankiaceae bacterium]|nr:alpha/beta hydrolase [Frankiaceae bacterium]